VIYQEDFESGRKSFKFGVESNFGSQLTGFVSKLELRIRVFDPELCKRCVANIKMKENSEAAFQPLVSFLVLEFFVEPVSNTV
jgi:hypothetical protein